VFEFIVVSSFTLISTGALDEPLWFSNCVSTKKQALAPSGAVVLMILLRV
jgi:hypothetical protein